ncbi:hypothetical protein [Nostoc sp.]|uniref:hypothetical protein n=1 Tax=Nostoc sp. TaxID=1180 RepID=UPI002FF775E4
MTNTLLVPIHLDALYLPNDTSVLEKMTDYSKLPYRDRVGNVTNREYAYLSETVLSPPFENLNLTLKAGIHLHWAMPDALTNGIAKADGITFPLLPNRWLIVRRGGNKPEKQWVVESDYLYAEGETPQDAINILCHPGTGEYQPFRFLGRKSELAQWPSGSANARYVEALTAIGPFAKVDNLDNEKAAFAGFYPNCRSVFGFHDDEFKGATPPGGLQYDLIGWYSNSEKDCLAQFVREHSANSAQTLLEALQEKMGWTAELGSQNFPDRILCYSQLTFRPGGSLSDPAATLPNPTIAVGNTQEEAIAAYLARQLDAGTENRKIIEEQLEALQMSDRLEQQKLDFGPKFRETLHENGFAGQTKEMLWRVVPEGNSTVPASAAQGEAQVQVTLPTSIGDQINTTNGLQHQYDQKLAKIGSIREQVYADWYKYMLATYTHNVVDKTILKNKPKPVKNKSDSDLIKAFIELPAKKQPGKKSVNQYGLPALNEEIKAAGVLSLTKDERDEIVSASAPNSESTSIAAQLVQSINNLIANINRFNKESRFIAPKGSQLTVEGSCTLAADSVTGNCLKFKDTENYFKVSGLNNVHAISMWVKIPDAGRGYLLDAENHLANSGFAASEIGSNWAKMYVNGQATDCSWANLPKNQWVCLYLEAKTSLNGVIHLMSNFNRTERTENLTGSIASVYFHQQPLSPDEIKQSYGEKIGLLRPSYILKIVPGPRYWQPSDPVILMTGDAVTATHRHGEDGSLREDGLLECELLTQTINWQEFPNNILAILKKKLDDIAKQPGEKIGFHDWKNQPWNPFLLEWTVQFFPLRHNSQNSHSNNYDTNILKDNYELQVNAVELSLKSTAGTNYFGGTANLYSGASFLSPSAGTLLKENLIDYLKKYLLPDYYKAQKIPQEQQTEDFLSQNFKAVKDWYKPENPSANNPVYTARRAYEQLQSLNCLAQSIGGFNDALLTYNRTMQLGVDDTRAGQSESRFLEGVRGGVNDGARVVPGSILRSPYLYNEFNPIRAGAMKISGLRIVDTFGRVKVVVDINNPQNTEIVTSQPLTPPPNCTYPIYLPPRLAQPARLNLRWLSASQGQQEMNDHPTTTPICGWILPNNLDNSLTIYDNQGTSLGILDRTATWRAIPGSNQLIEISDIANQYLRQLVQYLVSQADNEGFFTDFLTTVNKALETIDPEGFAQNQAISLLVARPLALVRSQVNLELQGLPAISQNDTAFSADIFVNDDRTTDAFPKVEFPIRIGEYQQFNDSLVGYWVETAEGTYKDNNFYAPQSCYVPHRQIKTLFDNAGDRTPDTPVNLEQTLEANTAQTLVMLVDPRGQVNASCGVLPAKRISIPPEQYVPALQAIEVTFLSAPLLSDINQINLSLPEVPGYVWSWLGKEGNNWSTATLNQFNSQATLSSPQKIYEGWLKLTRNKSTP